MKRKYKHYAKFVATTPAGEDIPLPGITKVADARRAVRSALDKLGIDYASLSGYDSKKYCIYISGVRSSKMKHYPVASATRG